MNDIDNDNDNKNNIDENENEDDYEDFRLYNNPENGVLDNIEQIKNSIKVHIGEIIDEYNLEGLFTLAFPTHFLSGFYD